MKSCLIFLSEGSKVKDFVLLFSCGSGTEDLAMAWPGVLTYLHNMQQANIQHDFAINESEKRLEMIFNLIEWHNWLDYTKFFFSLRNLQMLSRKQTNQADWARSCACFCVCFYSLLVHARKSQQPRCRRVCVRLFLCRCMIRNMYIYMYIYVYI